MLLLLASLQLVPVQQFPKVEHPGASVELRRLVDRVCGDPGTLDRAGLLAKEDKISWDTHGGHVAPATWLALGCVRGALEGDGALSRPGVDMAGGDSWALGGEHAMLEVLKNDPANARAAEVLAVLVLDDLDADADAVAAVMKAIALDVASPAVLRACSEHALRTGDSRTARLCATKGLANGNDSTWHLVRLARLAFRSGDTTGGVKQFLAAAGATHDTASHGEIAWHLQWFLSPEELKAAGRLRGPAAATWLRDRLAERDVRDGQAAGARLAEHFARLDYVMAHFRLHMPVRVRKAGGLVASTPENGLTRDSIRSFCEPGLLPAAPFRDYQRWQSEIDDRGVIWLRFGKPTRLQASHPVCADTLMPNPGSTIPASNTREAWLYDLDGKSLILNFESEGFSGSVDATRLVTGVLGSYFCGVDTIRCGLTQLSIASWNATHTKHGTTPQTPLLSPDAVEHVAQDDRAFIAMATTEDDNSPRGTRNVSLASRLHRLWDPLTGASIALVTYALPVIDLSVQGEHGHRTTLVDLELRQWDPSHDRWTDTAFSRHFEVPDTSLKRPSLVGFVVVPSTAGVSSWSMVARQPDQRRGRYYDVTTPGLGQGSVALSDLVFGAESQGVSWSLHNVSIALAPVNSVDRSEPVSLYYQIRCENAPTSLRTTIALYRINGGVPSDSAAFQVTYDQALHGGVNEIAPSIDVSRLDKGQFRLEVRLNDAAGALVVRRNAQLELR